MQQIVSSAMMLAVSVQGGEPERAAGRVDAPLADAAEAAAVAEQSAPGFSVMEVLFALMLLALVLLVCKHLRDRVKFFRDIFLPSSIVAGAVALLLGPQILGWIAHQYDPDSLLADGAFPAYAIEVWRTLPGILINVVFAGLLLGQPLPGIREIWFRAGPQVVFGQSVAWGQYVVGLLLAILILTPLFGTNPMAGALIEIGFEGGHGTSAGMRDTMEELGFPEGADIALTLATVGLVGGVLLGTLLVNWAVRTGRITVPDEDDEAGEGQLEKAGESLATLTDRDIKEYTKLKRFEISPTDPLSLHIGLIALAIVIGWVILNSLVWIEQMTWGAEPTAEQVAAALAAGDEAPRALVLIGHVPLFPMAMIGGVLIQIVIDRFGWHKHISRRMISRISGTALDFVIVAALATISLQAIGEHFWPILLLSITGVGWCVFALLFIAPRVIPYNWFERGIGDFGQSMGVTVTGLLLMRMADPENRSGCLESFGYKQLLFEPIVGGGLFTGMSVGLIYAWGPGNVLLLCSILTAGWLLFGWLYFGPLVREQRARGQT
jgi:glutamate:Na+ symporter, ESS family